MYTRHVRFGILPWKGVFYMFTLKYQPVYKYILAQYITALTALHDHQQGVTPCI